MNTFKRCDLHVHSSSCFSRPYNKKDFIDTLIGSDLDVVAITDHNVVDVPLLKEVAKELDEVEKKVLAGVELSVHLNDDVIAENKLYVPDDAHYFQAVVWCSVDDAEKLEAAVFELLDTIGIDAEQRKSAGCAKGISRMSDGKSFDFEEVKSKLSKINHYFVFHENKGGNNLSDYLPNTGSPKCRGLSEDDLRKLENNDKFKNKLFYYNEDYGLEGGEKSSYVVTFFRNELNTDVSSFFCSDATDLEGIGSKFTWIDFDGDLNSLNLAMSDPESRIVTSDVDVTQPQKNIRDYLEAVEFEVGRNGVYEKCKLEFSPGYNGIIGARGSGKSLLASVLSGRDVENYNGLVRKDSIKYRYCGGDYTPDPPKSLLLTQGGLQSIFEDGSYSKIPFLKGELSQMESEAKATSERCYEGIKRELDGLRGEVKGFIDKHGGRAVSIAVLSKEKPDGTAIAKPTSLPLDEKSATMGIADSLELANEDLRAACSKLNQVKAAQAPRLETERLAAAVSATVDEMFVRISAVQDIAERTVVALRNLGDEPFETRQELIREYGAMLEQSNRESSLELDQYSKQFEGAETFLTDLLELRIEMRSSFDRVHRLCEEMLRPIEPRVLSLDGGDTVTISLEFEEAVALADAVGAQFSIGYKELAEDNIAEFSIEAEEISTAKRRFNGNRFRSAANASDYVDKVFENICKDLEGNKKLAVDLFFNGESMKNMSPGTKAQILLRLFLQGSLYDEGFKCIILDQPEDNLDTQTIKEFLVAELKRLKQNVQLFVVSHSAPVIVNGDARNVVISEEDGGSITYSRGAINEPKTKQKIADILDGGERYLKMRLYKYDFQMEDER